MSIKLSFPTLCQILFILPSHGIFIILSYLTENAWAFSLGNVTLYVFQTEPDLSQDIEHILGT